MVWRDYRGDGKGAMDVGKFWGLATEVGEDGEQMNNEPVVMGEGGVTFAYVKHENVYLVASSRANANAAMLVTFLHSFASVLEQYFGGLEEESIRDNFVLVYELLDEVMDFGYPQFTEAKVLQEYIRTEAKKLTKREQSAPGAVTNAVSWRQEGIKYKRNEVYLDVMERITVVANSNGQVVHSHVDGTLQARAYLSGMPECKIGLNDRAMIEAQGRSTKRSRLVELEDIKFHQCVRLSRFDTDRTISFIPPDGKFELMSYRISGPLKPLIWIEPRVERTSRTRVDYLIRVRSDFKERNQATSLAIHVPVHQDAVDPSLKPSHGTATYSPESQCIVWNIKQMPGGKEYALRAHLTLPSTADDSVPPHGNKPIQLSFEVPYCTVSGTQVRTSLQTAISLERFCNALHGCYAGPLPQSRGKIRLHRDALGAVLDSQRHLRIPLLNHSHRFPPFTKLYLLSDPAKLLAHLVKYCKRLCAKRGANTSWGTLNLLFRLLTISSLAIYSAHLPTCDGLQVPLWRNWIARWSPIMR